jgi:hypothetical protein
MGITTTELRAKRSIAKTEQRQADAAEALRLKDKGLSNVAIGKQMGRPESSVRALLDPALKQRRDVLETTASKLTDRMHEAKFLDIGSGTEHWLGITSNQLSTAVAMMKEKGYEVRTIQHPQLFGKGKTTIRVLCPPGTGSKFIDPKLIEPVSIFTNDGGKTFAHIMPPVSVSSKRVGVRHAEEGGDKADGVIYLRPGVRDLSLGGNTYAQVRIAVDKSHYLKGMAMYKDDLPPGIDIMLNTSKHNTGNKMDAMKPPEGEGDTPWTTMIRRQRTYTDASGKTRLSPLNIVNEPGNWRDWRPSLSSQILSKQRPELAARQLGFVLSHKAQELNEIMALTNPVVKRKLLETYADSADSAAVHLKAKAMPRQGTHVILPLTKIREDQVFAPNYRNGETVALIRHPHGGTFEIPELKVNNRNPEGRALIGSHAQDAIGIHPNVAKRLSGADFDGDAVLVIPQTRTGKLRTTPPLAGLKNFDPHTMYAPYDGMRTIDGGHYNAKTGKVDFGSKGPSRSPKQHQMGDVSNLITDMTIKGAHPDEIARAVRHSMVVIDAEKHVLNVKQSYIDNGIAALKERYQGRTEKNRLAGASTIISRATSELRIPERRPRPASKGGPIDLATGRKAWEPTGKMTVTRKGAPTPRLIRTTRLAETTDARTLISKPTGTRIEEIYAAHSNNLKSLANRARLESLKTGSLRYSPSAAKAYSSEVSRLNAALNMALKNAPRERQAQIIARAMTQARQHDNPHMDADELKKVKAQSLQIARDRVGANKHKIVISDREWEAIQAGAITTNKMRQILNNSDLDRVKRLATPRAATVMTPQKMAIAKSRLAAGYTQAEVADSLGIPVSTLSSALLSGGR